jgi:peptidoglycan/LPS O-acetylase OafA/YrhL
MVESAFESRENNLDFVRLVLAILVILSHSWSIGTGDSVLEPMTRLSHGQATFGTIAVHAFFIISGFLITNSFLRSRSLWTYLKKRVARIYPGFIVCMVVCASVVVPLSGARLLPDRLAPRLISFVGRTLALHRFTHTIAFAGSPNSAINDSVWSIPDEFYCYLLVAVIGLVGVLRKRYFVEIMFFASLVSIEVVSFMAGSQKLITNVSLDRWFHFQSCAMLLAGMLFFLLRDKIPHKNSLAVASVLVLAIASQVPHAWYLAFAFAGTYLVFWFAFHPRISLHHAALYGDFSYGIYLYAFPIQQLITLAMGSRLNPYLLFLMSTPASLLAAVLSWYGVERWFLASGRRHGRDAPILAVPVS